jgi:hypothetical protein
MSHSPEPKPGQSVSVSLSLPSDIATALRQRAAEQGRSPTQVILDLLRMGLFSQPGDFAAPPPAEKTKQEELEQIAARLIALETVLPRVDALEERVNDLLERPSGVHLQDSEIASAPAEQGCPQCGARLGAPLKASGRQVCIQCGWANRPRHSTPIAQPESDRENRDQGTRDRATRDRGTASSPPQSAPVSEPSNADIYSILAKASEESKNNMKRQKAAEKSPKKSIQDLLGEP